MFNTTTLKPQNLVQNTNSKTHLTNHCFGIRRGKNLIEVVKATGENTNPHSHISILQDTTQRNQSRINKIDRKESYIVYDLFYESSTIYQVKSLDGLLITHIDNDHFSRPTCTHVKDVCKKYYAPNYVADVMNEEGYDTKKCDIHESFEINDLKITLTPAKHNWQNGVKKWQYRYWEEKDYCGYWIEAIEGNIWIPGDSKLIDEHLHMDQPDVILFDFADNEWHITFEGAVKLANTYPEADLICIHWGSVDAPEMTPFNGNPEDLSTRVVNPERIKVLAPGEKYSL